MAADDRIEHLIRFYSILDALEKNVGAPARVSLARVEMLSTFGRTELRIPQEGDFNNHKTFTSTTRFTRYGDVPTATVSRIVIEGYRHLLELQRNGSSKLRLSSPLFQVLVDRLGHLKHVQFLTAKDRLQLIVGQDFSFVLWILEIVLLNVRPNLFCDFTSR